MSVEGLRPPDIRPDQQTFTIILFRPAQSPALPAQIEAGTLASQRASQTSSNQKENDGVERNAPAYSGSTGQNDHSQSSNHPSKDFFISYTHVDQQWAEWIAWQLEEAGYTTTLQAWDFRAGDNFVLNMDRATKQAKRTIAVLSPDYLNSRFTSPEWATAFRRDPKGEQSLLVPVRVHLCDIEGLLGPIVYIDLVNKDEQAARAILLARVKQERHKPTSPPLFPPVAHTHSKRPTFPGAPPSKRSDINHQDSSNVNQAAHSQKSPYSQAQVRSSHRPKSLQVPRLEGIPDYKTDLQPSERKLTIDDNTTGENSEGSSHSVATVPHNNASFIDKLHGSGNQIHSHDTDGTTQTQESLSSSPRSFKIINHPRMPTDQQVQAGQLKLREFPSGDQNAFDDSVAPISQFAHDSSNPDKNKKPLDLPVPTASYNSHRPLLVGFRALFIIVAILALVVGIYFVNGRLSHSPPPTPTFGPASTTIEIASDFPTGGLETTDGLPLQNGVQMAITEANNEHLLPGYTLKPIPYNDVGTGNRHDPQVGANNLKQAIADNLIVGLVGPGNSSVAFKELPLANQAPLALLSPGVTFPCLTKGTADDPDCSGTNDVITQMHPTSSLTFFRLATTDDLQGKAATDLFTQRHSKVLLLTDSRDPYSSGLAQAFQTEWQQRGQVNLIDLPQNTSTEQDYQNKLQVASSQFQPDLIYFAGDDPNGSYVLQALSNIATLKVVPFAGGDGIMKRSLLQTAASLHRDAPIYVSLPIKDPAHSGTPTGADFATNYTANGYDYYRPNAASAYDCTMMLIQAIKTALQKGLSTPHGKQDHAGAVQFRQAVLQALRHLSYTGATGTHSFDANGDTTNHTVSFYYADLSTAQLSWSWFQQVNV